MRKGPIVTDAAAAKAAVRESQSASTVVSCVIKKHESKHLGAQRIYVIIVVDLPRGCVSDKLSDKLRM